MKLSPDELNSPLWMKLKAEWEGRLADLRAGNDGELDDKATAKQRGRIAEVKRNLDMGKPEQKFEVE